MAGMLFPSTPRRHSLCSAGRPHICAVSILTTWVLSLFPRILLIRQHLTVCLEAFPTQKFKLCDLYTRLQLIKGFHVKHPL